MQYRLKLGQMYAASCSARRLEFTNNVDVAEKFGTFVEAEEWMWTIRDLLGLFDKTIIEAVSSKIADSV